ATTSPHGSERVPGGSSSGSAVAVASGAVPIALGTDTGGSIRQPAAFCGCVGLKPSYGRVSRYGLIAFGSSLDQAGPITRDVADATIALRLMAGEDPRDMTSSARAVPEAVPVESCRGVRVGIPRSARSAHNHPSVNDALSRAADALENDGAEIVEIDLPHQEHAIAAYYVVAPAEASSNLSRYDGVRYGRRAEGATLEAMYVRSRTEGFGPEVRRRIMLGTQVLSGGYERAMYMKALKARRLIKRDFDRAMAEDGSGCSLVLTPTTPGPAFRIGEKAGDAMAMYLQDIYTVSVNLAGLPAVSIPAGSAEDGGDELPVGVQLVGPTFGEERLLGHAQRMETLLAPD
ncbi:MAG: amidase family protein, partial [Planctomycetota bacterium]